MFFTIIKFKKGMGAKLITIIVNTVKHMQAKEQKERRNCEDSLKEYETTSSGLTYYRAPGRRRERESGTNLI